MNKRNENKWFCNWNAFWFETGRFNCLVRKHKAFDPHFAVSSAIEFSRSRQFFFSLYTLAGDASQQLKELPFVCVERMVRVLLSQAVEPSSHLESNILLKFFLLFAVYCWLLVGFWPPQEQDTRPRRRTHAPRERICRKMIIIRTKRRRRRRWQRAPDKWLIKISVFAASSGASCGSQFFNCAQLKRWPLFACIFFFFNNIFFVLPCRCRCLRFVQNSFNFMNLDSGECSSNNKCRTYRTHSRNAMLLLFSL